MKFVGKTTNLGVLVLQLNQVVCNYHDCAHFNHANHVGDLICLYRLFRLVDCCLESELEDSLYIGEISQK